MPEVRGLRPAFRSIALPTPLCLEKVLHLRRKSLLFETLREREGFANDAEVSSLGAHKREVSSRSMRRSALCATRKGKAQDRTFRSHLSTFVKHSHLPEFIIAKRSQFSGFDRLQLV
jgi:hypothetical protein